MNAQKEDAGRTAALENAVRRLFGGYASGPDAAALVIKRDFRSEGAAMMYAYRNRHWLFAQMQFSAKASP